MTAMLADPAGEVEPRARFEALYRSSAARRLRVRRLAAARPRAAEDVTALAFERAYRRRALFDVRRGSARAWLFAIARNAALDELRRRRRTGALLREIADESRASESSTRELAERRLLVREGLASLDAAPIAR